MGGLKAAHFFAPYQPDNYYVSGSMPPGFIKVLFYLLVFIAEFVGERVKKNRRY